MNKKLIIKKIFGLLLIFLFVACNEQSHSDSASMTPITLNETQILTIDKTISIGTVIGDEQKSPKLLDFINNVELP